MSNLVILTHGTEEQRGLFREHTIIESTRKPPAAIPTGQTVDPRELAHYGHSHCFLSDRDIGDFSLDRLAVQVAVEYAAVHGGDAAFIGDSFRTQNTSGEWGNCIRIDYFVSREL